MSQALCAGCGANDPRDTEWGPQCPRCEVLLRRYNYSRDELNAFVAGWLKRWEAVGLSQHEAYEHLQHVTQDIGETVSPESGMGIKRYSSRKTTPGDLPGVLLCLP